MLSAIVRGDGGGECCSAATGAGVGEGVRGGVGGRDRRCKMLATSNSHPSVCASTGIEPGGRGRNPESTAIAMSVPVQDMLHLAACKTIAASYGMLPATADAAFGDMPSVGSADAARRMAQTRAEGAMGAGARVWWSRAES